MKALSIIVVLLTTVAVAKAEETAPSRIDSITKSARDMMPAMPSLPSVSLPSMPDLSLPDFSDATGRLMTEFNTFTQQVGDALPILEQMGYEVTTFKVTWGLPPKARLRLKSNGNADIQKVNAIAAKATSGGVLVTALITSAATAKRIQSTMKLGTAYLDVDFAVPPRVNMKFVSLKANEKEELPRDTDDLEICANRTAPIPRLACGAAVFVNVTNGIKTWLVGLFASTITHTTRPEDRVLAIRWLSQSREVVASEASSLEKLRQLNALINSRTTIKAMAKSISATASNYRKSNLPLSMKIALPATLAAIPFVGGHAAGIAAFGGALGVPVLLLVFLGTAGITSIIEAVVTSPEARPHIAEIIDIIIEDERLRQTSAQMKAAMKEQPMDPTRFAMPVEEVALRKYLLGMDPFNFERHTMSFFVGRV